MATLSSKPAPDYPVDHGKSIDPPNGTTSRAPGLEEGEDVLELCREAASMLGPNEMIHDPDFTLYGAMSALELMDAKMDKPPPALEVWYSVAGISISISNLGVHISLSRPKARTRLP